MRRHYLFMLRGIRRGPNRPVRKHFAVHIAPKSKEAFGVMQYSRPPAPPACASPSCVCHLIQLQLVLAPQTNGQTPLFRAFGPSAADLFAFFQHHEARQQHEVGKRGAGQGQRSCHWGGLVVWPGRRGGVKFRCVCRIVDVHFLAPPRG